MATPHDNEKNEAQPVDERPALMLAEFDTPGQLLHAAEKVRDAGYTVFDAHSPFPIHGMDAAMGLPDSKLGLIVFPIGLTGTTLAFLMMWWMNGVDYPLIIGGKPPYSLPSQIPIMFEVTVLLSAFATVLGMFHLNRLPRHHHPIFNSERFASFSNDKFFLSIEATDPKWNVEKTKKLLESCHPTNIELVYDDDEGGADFEGEEEKAA
jgi:hypothetical protein